MSILFGLTLLLCAAVITFVLPLLTFVRTSRLTNELEALRARLATLERELRESAGGRQPAGPAIRAAQTASESAPAVPREEVAPPPQYVPPVRPPAAEPPAPAPVVPPVPAVSREVIPPAAADAGLEAAIGGRLLLYAGVVVFVLGIAFFVKYAFDRAWITEGMRVTLGALCGLAFIGGGLRLARAGYDTYGNILAGGGIVALYLSTYAAFDFYALIGRPAASVLLVAITAAAAWLADRQRHQGLAVLAVSGGFLTPFLVGSGTDAQVTLFSYVALLIAGTMILARRRDWPLLNVVSYGLTALTVAAWADVYYRPSKYLRTEAFLTGYCAMFIFILRQTSRSTSPWKDAARLFLWSAPVLYHLASIAILQRHDVALPAYLILFALAGVAWSAGTDRAWLRLLVWAAAMLPFLGWLETHESARWIVPSLATLGALFALPLVAQMDRVLRRDSTLSAADLLLLHLNALATFGVVWIVLGDSALPWVTRIGLVLAVVHAAVARWLYPRDANAGLHALAAAFGLLAASVGVEFDSRWLTAAWAAEGAAIVWVGLRARSEWFRAAGLLLLAVAAGRWLALSAPVTPSGFTLVTNESFGLGVWIIALLYALAWSYRRAGATRHRVTIAGLLVAASAVTVALLTTQNSSYWEIQGATMADATFAEQLALSLLWAFYAGVLIAVGIRREYAPIRYAAIALIVVTVLKVFLVDLSGLEGIYRVLGLLLVGAVLLIVSFLYQRTRAGTSAPDTAGAPEPPQP